jgi:hypothetical protein
MITGAVSAIVARRKRKKGTENKLNIITSRHISNRSPSVPVARFSRRHASIIFRDGIIRIQYVKVLAVLNRKRFNIRACSNMCPTRHTSSSKSDQLTILFDHKTAKTAIGRINNGQRNGAGLNAVHAGRWRKCAALARKKEAQIVGSFPEIHEMA